MFRPTPAYLKRLASTGIKGTIYANAIDAGFRRNDAIAKKVALAMATPPTRRRLFAQQTPRTQTVTMLKKKGAATSRSRGFTRRGRKYRKTKRNTKNRKGVTLAYECGGTCSAKRVAFIGHCDMPIVKVREMFWRIILKRLFERVHGYSPSALLNQGVVNALTYSLNDTIELRYRLSASGAIAAEQYIAGVTGLATENSIDTVAKYFADPARVYHNSVNDSTFEMVDINFYPANAQSTRAKIRLLDATFDLYSKSTLKMQNRTINSVGNDEAEDVDNVPIHGKSYEGTGSGCVWKAAYGTNYNQADFIAGKTTGVIIESVQSTSLNGLQEPPYAGELSYVKRTGKMRLDPGDIKTSTLVSKIKSDVNVFYRKLQNIATTTEEIRQPFGKYRLFGLEKMIDAVQSDAGSSIIVAYEHNLRMVATMSEKYTTNTVQLFESNNLSL